MMMDNLGRHLKASTNYLEEYLLTHPTLKFNLSVGPFSSSTSARVPVRIPDSAFNNHKIVSVSAANDFSIAVCDQGDLYAWGIGLTSLPFWTQISNTPVIVE
jgi:alpha-tubulin suppressor-like RCC1 family protein